MDIKKKRPEYLQLDLIPPTELEKLYAEFREVKDSSDKVRRGIFAKHTDLSKKVQELTCQIENLQSQLIILNEWILTRLGSVINAQLKPEVIPEEMSSRSMSSNVEFVKKSRRSRRREITDGLFLSA
jgi:hypothetical protein